MAIHGQSDYEMLCVEPIVAPPGESSDKYIHNEPGTGTCLPSQSMMKTNITNVCRAKR